MVHIKPSLRAPLQVLPVHHLSYSLALFIHCFWLYSISTPTHLTQTYSFTYSLHTLNHLLECTLPSSTLLFPTLSNLSFTSTFRFPTTTHNLQDILLFYTLVSFTCYVNKLTKPYVLYSIFLLHPWTESYEHMREHLLSGELKHSFTTQNEAYL